MKQKLCAYCGTPFTAQRSTAKYCCDRCRNYDRRRRRQEQLEENFKATCMNRKPVKLSKHEVSD